MQKLIFIILDGVADRPVKSLCGKSPLEAAETPNLDIIAEKSSLGLMRVINRIPPETDTAVLAMFGYDPVKYNRGRGPLEAVGIDYPFNGQLAIRCNFATLAGSKIIDTEAERIESRYSRQLVKALQKNIELEVGFQILHELNYRFLLILNSKLSEYISNTHPGYIRRKDLMELPNPLKNKMEFEICRPLKPEARKTAEILNNFITQSREILSNHKLNIERQKEGKHEANAVLTRGAGNSLPKLKKLRENWFCLADTAAERGIAKLLGMRCPQLPEPYTDRLIENEKQLITAVKRDMKCRVRILKKNIDRYDCFYIHLKGADPFGHRGLPLLKKLYIESIDNYFFGKIDFEEFNVCITSDHTTACELKSHTADPVPVLVPNTKRKDGKRFTEKNCRKGSLGMFKATELMERLRKFYSRS